MAMHISLVTGSLREGRAAHTPMCRASKVLVPHEHRVLSGQKSAAELRWTSPDGASILVRTAGFRAETEAAEQSASTGSCYAQVGAGAS